MKGTSVWRHFDLWLAAAVLLLTAYGILAIRSAVTGAPAFEDFPQRQVIFALIGLAVMVAIAAIDYRILTSSHWYIYVLIVVSLIAVYLVGVINNASRRWFDLGLVQLQPSEFVKLTAAIFIAKIFAEYRQEDLGLRER